MRENPDNVPTYDGQEAGIAVIDSDSNLIFVKIYLIIS